MEEQLKNPSIAWLFTGWRTQPLALRRVCRAIPLSEPRLWHAAQDECALDSAAIANIEPEVRVSMHVCACAGVRARARAGQGCRECGKEGQSEGHASGRFLRLLTQHPPPTYCMVRSRLQYARLCYRI